MNLEESFITDILRGLQDDKPRLAYAEWLEVEGDLRADYLRTELDWAKTRNSTAEARLREMAVNLDPVWVARVSRPPVGVCADHLRFREPFPNQIRPKLSSTDLDWMERRFELKLPVDFRAFLLNYNGGLPEPFHFRIPGRTYGQGEYEELACLSSVWAAVETEADWERDLVANFRGIETWRAECPETMQNEPYCELVQIGRGPPNGKLELVWLGCRGRTFGRVFYVAAGLPRPDLPEEHREIAPSFAEFLGMLTDYDPDHIQAIKAGNVAVLRRWLNGGGNPDELYHDMSLLMHGVLHARPESIEELLAHGATVDDYLMEEARDSRSLAIIDLLQAHHRLSNE